MPSIGALFNKGGHWRHKLLAPAAGAAVLFSAVIALVRFGGTEDRGGVAPVRDELANPAPEVAQEAFQDWASLPDPNQHFTPSPRDHDFAAAFQAPATPPATLNDKSILHEKEPAVVPLVMIDAGNEIAVTEQEVEAWGNLQQRFVQSFGAGQNPNDPGYYQRWQDAQALLDEQAHALFGQGVYSAMVGRRFRQSESP